MRSADALASEGDYDEATRRYLLALDEGRVHVDSFHAARRGVVRKLAAIAAKYPPAQEQLAARSHAFANRISMALDGGADVDPMDVKLFVLIGCISGNETEVRTTHAQVKARQPPDSRLRAALGGAYEVYLVQERRYVDALAVSDAAVIDYYLELFRPRRNQEWVREAIEFTIANECGAHYEALLAGGRKTDSEAFEDRLIEYRPTAHTFSVLIERAQRIGASEAATRLRARARTMNVALGAERSPS